MSDATYQGTSGWSTTGQAGPDSRTTRRGPGRGFRWTDRGLRAPQEGSPPRPCAELLDSFGLDRGISPRPADHESHREHSVFSFFGDGTGGGRLRFWHLSGGVPIPSRCMDDVSQPRCREAGAVAVGTRQDSERVMTHGVARGEARTGGVPAASAGSPRGGLGWGNRPCLRGRTRNIHPPRGRPVRRARVRRRSAAPSAPARRSGRPTRAREPAFGVVVLRARRSRAPWGTAGGTGIPRADSRGSARRP